MPENSLAAFRAAIDAGAGIECDVRLSRDDEAMIFHDADLRRLVGETAALASLDSAALASKRLGRTNERIPRLAELLALCARRVPLLVEVKTGRASPARLCAAVARALGGLPGATGVMSFDPRVGAWLARHRPDVRRGLVLSGGDGSPTRWLKIARARPQFLAVNCDVIDQPWIARARRRLPVYSWTVRDAMSAARVAIHADASIWEADGRPRD